MTTKLRFVKIQFKDIFQKMAILIFMTKRTDSRESPFTTDNITYKNRPLDRKKWITNTIQ